MPCVRAFDLPHAFLVPLGTNWKGRIEGPGLRGSMAPSGYVACAALKPAGSEGPIGDRIGLLHRGPGISTAIIPPARAAGRGGDGQLHLRIAHRGPAVDRCGPDPALRRVTGRPRRGGIDRERSIVYISRWVLAPLSRTETEDWTAGAELVYWHVRHAEVESSGRT
jgi:hypothetical protein